RELLGELLLALRRPAAALTAFEASQQRAPERFRGLYGAAQAAAQSNDIAQAKRYSLLYLLSAPLTIPLGYCHINSFRRASSGGEAMARRRKEDRRASLASRGI